ncbi:Glycine oxidase ThiO [Minicystis rosea]|nr:Glycine oxidase ThiO [Minicystis rosea]
MPRGVSTVVLIGGGVIGCATALTLARRGVRAIVLERGTTRTEQPGETGVPSWAAAGILSAQVATKTDGPLSRLCVASRALYPAFAERIRSLTGRDVELRSAGVLRPAWSAAELADLRAEIAWQERVGLRVEHLDAAATRALEPALSHEIAGSVRFPDDPRIDPPALLAALRDAIERAGAELRFGAEAQRVIERDGRARGVVLRDGTIVEADTVVVTAGAWSSLVEGTTLPTDAVRPARGQIVELRVPEQILRGVVEGDVYLSPRDDGRILVGSTVEHVGFQPVTTAVTVRDLITAAIRLAPALENAAFSRAWGGLRPYAADELPILGPTAIEGLLVATAHFRNGVVLAPVTADVITATILGEPVAHDVAAFSPSRLANA